MIEEKIKKLLKERKWTFVDFQDMENIVDEFNLTLQTEMTVGEKLNLIFDKKPYVSDTIKVTERILNGEVHREDGIWEIQFIPVSWDFQDIFSRTVSEQLSIAIANALKEQLMNANINFNKEDEKNEISKNSLVGKSPKGSKTVSKKSDEKQK